MAHEQQTLNQLLNQDVLANAEKFYAVDFTALNGSGVDGQALLTLDEDTNSLTVIISASGLEPGQVHPQHIHGFPSGQDADVPTLAVDADNDGFIELAEGLTTYGPILLALTSPPGGALTDFPTAPDGTILFSQTYQLPAGQLDTDPMLFLREIVLHGMTVPDGVGAGTEGEVDGSNGYLAVLPVAAGEIEEVSAADAFNFLGQEAADAFAGASLGEKLDFNRAFRDELRDYRQEAQEDFRETLDALRNDYRSGDIGLGEFLEGLQMAQKEFVGETVELAQVNVNPTFGYDTGSIFV